MKRQLCSLQTSEHRHLLSSSPGPQYRACPHPQHVGNVPEERQEGRRWKCLIALSHGQVSCQK